MTPIRGYDVPMIRAVRVVCLFSVLTALMMVLAGCEEMPDKPTGPSEPAPEPEMPSEPAPEPETPSEPAPEPETPSEPAPEPETPNEPAPEPETPNEPAPEPETPNEPAPAFKIEIAYEQPLPALLQEELARAVEYWEDAIVADTGAPMTVPQEDGQCFTILQGRETDDLLISVTTATMELNVIVIGGVTIDNTPRAIAVNCAERPSGVPFYGRILFTDNASEYRESNRDRVYDMARHEIAHLLGFGTSTSWNKYLSGGFFHGLEAMRHYGGPVPVDGQGHWLAVDGLSWDIMSTPSSVVRAVTLGALQDIGHRVDYSAAETPWCELPPFDGC